MRSDVLVSDTLSIICIECYNDFFCDVAHIIGPREASLNKAVSSQPSALRKARPTGQG